LAEKGDEGSGSPETDGPLDMTPISWRFLKKEPRKKKGTYPSKMIWVYYRLKKINFGGLGL